MAFKKLVLASSNQGKLQELTNSFKNFAVELIPQSQLNITDAAETGGTFFENAIIKARHAAKLSGLPAIADDSGLVVNAINGAPGIYSARYAGENASDIDRCNKLLKAMQQVSDNDRDASFHCVLVLMRNCNDPAPIVCHGVWNGYILHRLRGESGFGYDPIFYDAEHGCSSAELDPTVKQSISHRAKALNKLITAIEAQSLLKLS